MADISDISALSLIEMRDAISLGNLCPVEVVDACLSNIESDDSSFNAFTNVMAETARGKAKIFRDNRDSKDILPPLFGIPYAVKDIIDVAGEPTTCHSRAMPLLPRERNAKIVDLLDAAGAICVGKTALSEFALSDAPSNSPWSPTRNPLNPDYTPGSSSNGSAVAVAAGFIPFSLGTDTGGSIRDPAAATGLVGLKPSYGAVSTEGVFPLSATLDTVGPLARTVDDIAAVTSVIAPRLVQPVRSRGGPLKIGLIRHFWNEDQDAHADVRTAMAETEGTLKAVGAELVDVKLPSLSRFNEIGWCILLYEAFHIHKKQLAVRPESYGSPVYADLMKGSSISEADYQAALEDAAEMRMAVDQVLSVTDVLLTTTGTRPPARVDDRVDMELYERSSTRIAFNVTGHPALATPIGVSECGLPIACQWITKHGDEMDIVAGKANGSLCLSEIVKTAMSEQIGLRQVREVRSVGG